MSDQGEMGPVYGVKLINILPVGGMLQAMPSRADLEQVRGVSERTVAGYEVLLSHYLALKAEHESRMGCVIRNCARLDDTRERDEPCPMSGPTWAKVGHVMGLGSTSAIKLCREYDVDPFFNCSASEDDND